MNPSFINRLVGTTIVVVAAIVFIPNILDGEKVQRKEGFKSIPERPEFEAISLEETTTAEKIREQAPQVPVIEEQAIDEAPTLTAEPNQSLADISNQVKPSNNDDTVVVETLKPEVIEEKVITAKRPEHSQLNEFAWVVQLGSFSHKANVQTLLAKLKSGGFTAFTKPIKTPSGVLTKVFVGPELEKQKLQRQLPKLKKLTGLDGKVTQFEISK